MGKKEKRKAIATKMRYATGAGKRRRLNIQQVPGRKNARVRQCEPQ
ncbi:MAG: hypothetical protein JSV13_06060 [Nitrospiraceae bacterium]|nr:MAG: hypothetical protein JSV13_06060 [Nitrospiraceae bacterium]